MDCFTWNILFLNVLTYWYSNLNKFVNLTQNIKRENSKESLRDIFPSTKKVPHSWLSWPDGVLAVLLCLNQKLIYTYYFLHKYWEVFDTLFKLRNSRELKQILSFEQKVVLKRIIKTVAVKLVQIPFCESFLSTVSTSRTTIFASNIPTIFLLKHLM